MKTKDITYIALFVAFISVSAQIAIPIGPIPFTLQTMLVLLAGLMLGGKKGFITLCIYVLVGAIGIPVFAGFKGGVSSVVAQTGGFIVSFPIMAYIAGSFSYRFSTKVMKYLGCIIGVIVNFFVGCTYFMFITKLGVIESLTYTVFPFVVTTILQIIFAISISERLNKSINIIK